MSRKTIRVFALSKHIKFIFLHTLMFYRFTIKTNLWRVWTTRVYR